jgi:hypothetical protein
MARFMPREILLGKLNPLILYYVNRRVLMIFIVNEVSTRNILATIIHFLRCDLVKYEEVPTCNICVGRKFTL